MEGVSTLTPEYFTQLVGLTRLRLPPQKNQSNNTYNAVCEIYGMIHGYATHLLFSPPKTFDRETKSDLIKLLIKANKLVRKVR